MSDTIKVFITKYALYDGIMEVDAELCGNNFNMIIVKEKGYFDRYFSGDDWHRTRESAVKRAEIMRDRAIKSAENRILKLKNMQF